MEVNLFEFVLNRFISIIPHTVMTNHNIKKTIEIVGSTLVGP